MPAIESGWIERLRDRAIGRTRHRLHFGVRVVLPLCAVARQRVALAPDGKAAVSGHGRAPRIALLLKGLPARLIHAQHPRRALAARARRREEEELAVWGPARIAALRARRGETHRVASRCGYDPDLVVVVVIAFVDRLDGERYAGTVRRHGGRAERRQSIPVVRCEGTPGRCLRGKQQGGEEGGYERRRPSNGNPGRGEGRATPAWTMA